MGLFNRGPERVIRFGQQVRGRIVAIDVGNVEENGMTRRIDEYVVAFASATGERTLGLRQELVPDVNVRLGMDVVAWVRDDDLYIDWRATMAERSLVGRNVFDRWRGGRDANRTGITDATFHLGQSLRQGRRGTLVITALRWDSIFGGMITTLTICGTVTVGTDQPYDVEIGRQTIPHYAAHLPTAGSSVPVIVSAKRNDKVTIDWPRAALAEPGIGVAAATEVTAAFERLQATMVTERARAS